MQVDRVQKEFKPLLNRFQYKKFRGPKKVSIIQEPFFNHGVMNNFGKFSIIAEPFTNQHPTLIRRRPKQLQTAERQQQEKHLSRSGRPRSVVRHKHTHSMETILGLVQTVGKSLVSERRDARIIPDQGLFEAVSSEFDQSFWTCNGLSVSLTHSIRSP